MYAKEKDTGQCSARAAMETDTEVVTGEEVIVEVAGGTETIFKDHHPSAIAAVGKVT